MSEHVLEKQFVDLAHQSETAELGIWGFIATEVLFLGGLFAAYGFFRYLHPAAIAQAAAHTDLKIGAANTALLLTSSFFMSWASLAARDGESRIVARVMFVAAALGVVFLGLKAIEYTDDIHEHLWPGPGFSLPTADPKAGEVFYFIYWLLTGIHALHLMAGIGAILVIANRARHGVFTRAYHAPVRVVSLYWHFVDIVWIFLFALIYLPGRGG
ncbi:MAG TPA: cytochrome c oxidase subunit 3 [Stellaceae bacterium]|jgi:cytochrome c oxidase subunit 3|nr:cytochrome c oxidase subunit 3 [Stellaceae bacterium]